MNPVSREFKEIRRALNDEVIEIGAVKLDENFQQIGEFQCYVKPEYGEIKQHITRLTGITQEMVADKDTFSSEKVYALSTSFSNLRVILLFLKFITQETNFLVIICCK